jgi:hypothetical protein
MKPRNVVFFFCFNTDNLLFYETTLLGDLNLARKSNWVQSQQLPSMKALVRNNISRESPS